MPWTLEYHDTKFAFTLAKPGPVVIVLSQLDDRYFRGLEGQYRFELNFRVHRAGEDDYLVRTQHSSRMNRSINVELDLDAGEYLVLVKIDATRNEWILPTEDVVRNNARHHREKLLRIGLSYDLAHSKAKIKESPEEKAAREAHEQRKKDKQRESLRKAIMEEKEINYYSRMKNCERAKRRTEKNKERMKRKAEKRKAKMEKKKAKREEEERKQAEESAEAPVDGEGKGSKDQTFSLEAALKTDGDRMAPQTVDTAPSTDAGQPTPSVSSTGATEVDTADRLPEPVLPDPAAKDEKTPAAPSTDVPTPQPAPAQEQAGESSIGIGPTSEQSKEPCTQNTVDMQPVPLPEANNTPKDVPQDFQSPRPTEGEGGGDRTKEIENKLRAAVNLFSSLKQELELMLGDSINTGLEPGQEPKSKDTDGRRQQPPPPPPPLRGLSEQRTLQPPMPGPTRQVSSPPPPPPPHDNRQQRPLSQMRGRSPMHPPIEIDPSSRRSRHRNGPPPPPPPRFFDDPPRQNRNNGGPPFFEDTPSESSSLSSDSEDDYSISSISDISDRELDMHIRDDARRNGRLDGSRQQAILPPPPPPPPQNPLPPGPPYPGPPIGGRGRDPRGRHGGRRDVHMPVHGPPVDVNAEFEKNPWNAVAVVGLRVYYRVGVEEKDVDAAIAAAAAAAAEGKDAASAPDNGEVKQGKKEKEKEKEKEKDTEMVKLKVIRPNPWEIVSDDEKDAKKKEKEKNGEKRESKWTRGFKKSKKKEREGAETEKEDKDKKGDETAEGEDKGLKKEEVEKVLDVDDSAKDATLEGEEREKTVAEGQV